MCRLHTGGGGMHACPSVCTGVSGSAHVSLHLDSQGSRQLCRGHWLGAEAPALSLAHGRCQAADGLGLWGFLQRCQELVLKHPVSTTLFWFVGMETPLPHLPCSPRPPSCSRANPCSRGLLEPASPQRLALEAAGALAMAWAQKKPGRPLTRGVCACVWGLVPQGRTDKVSGLR